MNDVTANNRTIVHRGDGLTNVAALPDVCKTPTPAGPTPVPYPNVARDADLAKGSKHVKIAGTPVGHAKSELSRSSGDEAGTLGGIVSGKNRGKMTWGSSSPNVLVEGHGVVRFGDPAHHNCNTFNVVHVQGGAVVVVLYGDDAPCALCEKKHEPMQMKNEAANASALVDALIAKLSALPDQGVRTTKDRRTEEIVTSGFMVGVVVTQCNQKYAACSALPSSGPHEGFVQAAQDAGMIPCVLPGLQVVRQAMLPSARRNLDKMAQARGQTIREWSASAVEAEANRLNKKAHRLDGNPIGNCAAQRAIAAALLDEHVPTMLCEKWYGPSGTRSTTVNVKGAQVRRFAGSSTAPPVLLSSGAENVPRGHGRAVPSCTTCQHLIPQLLCFTRDQKCH
ncbi:DUF4150 domain-containing protein [Nannocystis punicea]|uniref:DUF4150 domain-containing protein n=1 Tax=Nannocystis punicea TaxID=2995304 RepID=A0ABY7HDL4_9BACT|nr:DUF4150 domain-containing protein [Nannocystis poenicansa]WAS97364.1 DUF4150 domain-containing protein [Nannocystis poenicansa]